MVYGSSHVTCSTLLNIEPFKYRGEPRDTNTTLHYTVTIGTMGVERNLASP